MALSNIFREPGKEIAETVVGLAVVGGVIGCIALPGYLIAWWIIRSDTERSFVDAWIEGALSTVVIVCFGVAVVCFGVALLLVAHILGEAVIAVWRARRR